MKYFAYGSNMNPDRMRGREINFSERKHTILEGWRLEFRKVASRNPEEGYANIEKDKRIDVKSIIYTIRDSDIEKLDKYEGNSNYYERLRVRVKLDDGKEEEAITYVSKSDKVRIGLKPSKEYVNHLLKGCDLLSKEYGDKLRRWETLD